MAKSNEVVVKFLGDDSQFKRVVGSVEGGLGRMGNAAGLAAKAIATAAAAIGAFSLNSFAKFEDAMAGSLAIMGDVSDETKEILNDTAREIATTTRKSAVEAAEAYFFLASAGLTAEQSIAQLPQVAAFAQAGLFDMALATDLLTDAQSALGLSSDDVKESQEGMTRVSDALVKANTLANATVEQFSRSLTNQAGPALRIVGKDIEEGLAVLSVFADQGVKAEEAGTKLGIVLRDLQTKAIKFSGEFEKAGVTVFDATGDMRNMADIIGDLEGAMVGLSDEAKKSLLLDMGFSDRSINSLQMLFGTSEQIRGYEEALRDAGGTTEEVAAKQLESFSAQMDLLKSRLNDIAIEIGSKIAPLILDGFAKIDEWWDAHGPALTKKIKAVFQAIGDWWETNWPPVKELILTAFDIIAKWWEDNSAKIRAIMDRTLEVIIAAWERVLELYREVLPKVLKTVEDLVATAKAIWEQWGEEFVETVQVVFEQLMVLVAKIWDLISGLVELVRGIITGDWDMIWTAAQDIFFAVFEGIQAIVEGFAAVLILALTIVADILWGLIERPLNATKDAVGVAIDATVNFFKLLPGRAKDALRGLPSAAMHWVSEAFKQIKNLLWKLPGEAWDAMTYVGKRIGDAAVSVFNAGKKVGEAILGGIRDALSFVGGIGEDIGSAIASAVKRLINSQIINPINRALEFSFNTGIPFLGTVNINPPDIPQLASGGVTGVNQPFMAVVGDNKTQREIITPEGLMRQIVREELTGSSSSSRQSSSSGGISIGQIIMKSNASAKDVSEELRWLSMTGGV